jgi:hypothetical protein
MANDKITKKNLMFFTRKSSRFFHKNLGHFSIALARQKNITWTRHFYFRQTKTDESAFPPQSDSYTSKNSLV